LRLLPGSFGDEAVDEAFIAEVECEGELTVAQVRSGLKGFVVQQERRRERRVVPPIR
jgi:hypothetical protein